MKSKIKTTEGIIRTVGYLTDELEKNHLYQDIAIIYLDSLLSNEINERVERPFFTFVLNEFDKYIRFFKRYNLISSVNNANTFLIDVELKGNTAIYTLSDPEAIEIYNSI